MAHYAKVDNGLVTQVVVVSEDYLEEFVSRNPGFWVQTSYNTYAGVHALGGVPLRKNFAGVGYTYDAARDAFIPPMVFASWVLNEETCQWEPPIAYPDDGRAYVWNEAAQSWSVIDDLQVVHQDIGVTKLG
jgi:hypothetical protein